MMATRGRVWPIWCAVFVACLAWAGQASAQGFNELLLGDYAFTGEAVCLTSSNGFVVDPFSGRLVPNPPTSVSIGSFSVQGVRTFNGDGTGTVVGRGVNINQTGINANAFDFSANFTYAVASDLTFTVVQGPVTLTSVLPAMGSSTITGITFSGRISQDLNTLVSSTHEASVEIRTVGPSVVNYQVCHRARTEVKIN